MENFITDNIFVKTVYKLLFLDYKFLKINK